MSDHLSAEQFANCFVGEPTDAESRHLGQCRECSAALDRFDSAVASFRAAIHDRVEVHVESRPSDLDSPLARPASRLSGLRWIWVTTSLVAFILVGLVTAKRESPNVVSETSIKTDPDELMGAINLHLSRTVPAPMEPILVLVPNDEPKTGSGGVR